MLQIIIFKSTYADRLCTKTHKFPNIQRIFMFASHSVFLCFKWSRQCYANIEHIILCIVAVSLKPDSNVPKKKKIISFHESPL